jgi:hypothetical protein
MFKRFEVVEFGSEDFWQVLAEQAFPYSGNQSPLTPFRHRLTENRQAQMLT